MGCHFLLQRIFPTQGSNLCLLHWQADSLPLAPPGKPHNKNYFAVQQKWTKHCKSTILQKVSQFSCSAVPNSLWSHGLQHARLRCPSPTSGVCSNSRPLSRWCHPTISSSVPFSSHLQSFPATGSFPMCRLFSISPSNEYSGLISFRIDWFDLLAIQGTLKSPLQYHSSKSSILLWSAFFMVQLSQPLTSFNFHNYPSHALESPYYIDIFRTPLLWMKGEICQKGPRSPPGSYKLECSRPGVQYSIMGYTFLTSV